MKQNYKNALVALCSIFFLAPLWINTVQAQASGNIRTQTVTIGFANEPLRDALFALGRATGFQLVFPGTSVADVTRLVDLPTAERSVETTLNLLLQGTNLEFQMQGDNIVFSERNVATATIQQERHHRVVVGRVIDDGTNEPLPFVTVALQGTTTGTVTSVNGDFTIGIPSIDAVLVFSFLGYETIEVPATQAQNVRMRLAATMLDVTEIISTGYQQLSRERMTGSFAMITYAQIQDRMQPTLASMIEGLAPGVVVTPAGLIEVRGISTVMTNTQPLIVVDGFPLIGVDADLNSINPNNIESIVFLKCAVAASIYGSRSSNGVIVITTKTGSGRIAGGRDFSISYRNSFGIAMKPDLSLMNFASVSAFMDAEYDLFLQNPVAPFNAFNNYTRLNEFTFLLMARNQGLMSEEEADRRIAELRGNNALQQINDYLFQRRISQEHNLSIHSRSSVNHFGASIRYLRQRGDVITFENERITADINNAWMPRDWITVRTIANINFTTFDNPGTGWHFTDLLNLTPVGTGGPGNAGWVDPYTNMFDANGNPLPWFAAAQRRQATYDMFPGMRPVLFHPLEDVHEMRNFGNNLTVRLGGSAEVRFTDFLSGSVGGTWIRGASMNRTFWSEDSYRMRLSFNDGTSRTNPVVRHVPAGGRLDESRGTANNWVFRTQINYQQNFNNFRHRLTGFAAAEVMQETNEAVTMPTRFGFDPRSATFNAGFNLLNMQQNVNAIQQDMLFARSAPLLGGHMGLPYAVRDQRRVSWMGNFSYEFDNTYIISGSVRWELSNFYGTAREYRYRPTWSIGGTYKMINKPYMAPLRDIFDRFNVRATFGVLGSDVLNFLPYLVLLPGAHQVVTGGISNSISAWPNPRLRYERKRNLNFGLDMSMFRHRLDLTIDLYHNHSYDLIAQEPADPTTGLVNTTLNAGELRNRGIEVSARAHVVRTNNFQWTTSPVVSYNRTQVLRWDVTRAFMGSMTGNPIMLTGHTADAFFGPRFAGLNEFGLAMWYLREPERHRDDDGTYRYIYTVNTSGLDARGPDNAFYQGTSRPPLHLAWTNSFRFFRNWEASFMFVGSFGAVYRRQAFQGNVATMNHRTLAYRWRQPGDEDHTIYPVLLAAGQNDWWQFPNADVLITSANFVRLRHLTISYNLPANLVRRIGLSNVRIDVSGRNLLTFKHRDADIDPETRQVPATLRTMMTTTVTPRQLPITPEFFFGVQINL
ncbi:MAG: SusC/RagA family TonB-linked outer membrane protein [Bacteroidales bacterium]|nr:SusC/RagA family TonB-linked outer membrane protein [Bacteroidales bacterium]